MRLTFYPGIALSMYVGIAKHLYKLKPVSKVNKFNQHHDNYNTNIVVVSVWEFKVAHKPAVRYINLNFMRIYS